MKKLIELVEKSFVSSDKLNGQIAVVNEMKMKFVSGLFDAQYVEFLKLYVEIESLQKSMLKNTLFIHTKYVKIFSN